MPRRFALQDRERRFLSMRKIFSTVFISLAIGIALLPCKAAAAQSELTDLLVDGVRNPLAVDRNNVQFSWQMADNERGAKQTAYQILISNDPETLNDQKANWWDSAKINSEQSASLPYDGPALPPTQRFWWKVRIWDQKGLVSPYSAPSCFDTGLDRWRAQFVWDGTTNENNFAFFRKTFTVQEKPKLAKVYVTAHNDYMLYVNGKLVGRGPARCDPYAYGQYNGFDITNLVRQGENVLAAKTHWQGTWFDSGVNGEPAFLLEAHLDYPDGTKAIIGTDTSWKVLAHTPFVESNPTYFVGRYRNRAAIDFDSRLEPKGWANSGFDDLHWAAASAVDRPNYHLFAQVAPLEREQAKLIPVKITEKDGAWLVDFGKCIDGWPKLTLHANHPGDVVRVEYFQMNGERNPAGWDQCICSGGNETWDADFGRHTSFQELRITGFAGPLRADDVRGMWAYCDADFVGQFKCSNPLLNAIYAMCVRSAQQNIQQGIISVDANREQSPWLADSWNIGNVLLYNDRDTTMMDKVVRDYAAKQFANGSFPACAPSVYSHVIPEWAMYWPMLLWQQYLFSGDKQLLREMAPRVEHLLIWLKTSQDPNSKLINPPGWRISDYAGGNMPSGGFNIATACQYYEDLCIASRICSALGKPSQERDYLWQAEEVKAGINKHLFNGEYYLARKDRKEFFPLASAWALRFDIVPPALQPKILELIEKAGKPNIGGYGGDALYSGLLNADGGNFAVRDLARYRPMLDANQANWESFDLQSGEVNHAWTAYPGYLFQKYICGIQPTSGGFATFDVRPAVSGLNFAEEAMPTVKGIIRTRWEKKSDGSFSLSLHVPANSQASIYIPKLQEQIRIEESEKQVWPTNASVEGILAVQEQEHAVKCVVGAGDYRFEEEAQK
jgi:alpha-L-rhamnosidase